MGYAHYDLDDGAGPRGYSVPDVCHAEGCEALIDRGLSYLCYGCGGYFCSTHQTIAFGPDDEPIEFENFAGKSQQCCAKCKTEALQVPQ